MTLTTRRRFALVVLLALAGVSPAAAQNRSATLAGIVKDSTGAVLSGATVTPGRTAPVASLTTPDNVALRFCAKRGAAGTRQRNAHREI